MTRRGNFANKRLTSRDSYQTPNYAKLVPQNPLQAAAQPKPTFVNAIRQNLEIDRLDPDQTIATPEEVPTNAITAARVLLAGLSGQEASQIDFYAEEPSEEQVIEAMQRTGAATDLVTRSRRSGNEITTTVLTATGNTDIDRKKRLVSNSEIQFVHVHKHKRHDLQGEYDASADGHERAREPAENVTVTSNTSSIQYLNAVVTTSITPDRWSTSSFCRHVIKENRRLYRRTRLGTEEADCIISYRHDQEQAGDNATRVGSGSSQKTDTRNQTDCVFTTTESITTVELESIRTTESILQPAPSTVDIGIITTIISLPILRATNATLTTAHQGHRNSTKNIIKQKI
ncbi:MAG: hypothetical protein EZS28_032120 [Streblomastix strix]|uniref:Uncharacterized protein n=1 Tax=Streblomastix strix TaxID=222440 RepID=A0A5J4UQ85_9EUKA|nr:MAG: hypothetical protein EZS28_032120 [Streblomastix strix]